MRAHTDKARGGKRVHRSLENFDEYNIEAPLLTSPRSLEACLRQGLEPEELVFRYVDSFAETGVSPDLQEIRWKHYEKKRLDKLAHVREERHKLVQSGWAPPQPKKVVPGAGGPAAMAAQANENETSTAALKEQRAIESMKARRAAELDGVAQP